MTPNSVFDSGADSPFRKPLDRKACRDIAIVVVLGMLFGTVLSLVAVPTWEVALAGALLSLPGSLLAGAVLIYLQRRWPTKPTNLWQKLKVLAIIVALTVAAVRLDRWMSLDVYLMAYIGILLGILLLLASLCQRVFQPEQKGNDRD